MRCSRESNQEIGRLLCVSSCVLHVGDCPTHAHASEPRKTAELLLQRRAGTDSANIRKDAYVPCMTSAPGWHRPSDIYSMQCSHPVSSTHNYTRSVAIEVPHFTRCMHFRDVDIVVLRAYDRSQCENGHLSSGSTLADLTRPRFPIDKRRYRRSRR